MGYGQNGDKPKRRQVKTATIQNSDKSKIQIFCRHSADMEENANKLHFNRL